MREAATPNASGIGDHSRGLPSVMSEYREI